MNEKIREQPVVVVLGADNTIMLPDTIARQCQLTDRFVLLQQDDTIILKRIAVPRVTELVAAAPDEPASSLDEISAMVHKLRADRRPR
jgi:hypothetical protein